MGMQMQGAHALGIWEPWGFAEMRPAKFSGARNFGPRLKEREWRHGRVFPEPAAPLKKLVAKNKTLMA